MNKRVKKKSKLLKAICQGTVILLIAIFLVLLSTTILNLIKNPTNIFVLEKGSIKLEEETEGLIIRDEIVIKGENYTNGMLQIKTEGERVAKGEAIFRYYSQDEETLKEKIIEAENKIQENIPEGNEMFPGEITLIEEQIEEKLFELNKLSDLQKIRELKQDINTYMTKKIQILGNALDKSSEVKQWINQKQNLENELAKNSEYINATKSGVVSYRIDGYEDDLKTENFDYINKEIIKNVDKKPGEIIATSEDSGKIINNFESYIAVNLNSEAAKFAKVGDKLEIQLSSAEKIEAKIEYIKVEEDDSRTIVIKITKKIEELVKYRKISITIIWWETTGFMVPNSAIIEKDNKNYIARNKNGLKTQVLVKIKQQNEKNAIVENYTIDELKELGYDSKEISVMKQIELYDEIIINNKE